MPTKAIITLLGDRGAARQPHKSRAIVSGVTDKAAADTLATALAAYTNCTIDKVTFVDEVNKAASPPGADVSIDERGVVYYNDADDGNQRSITLAGWDLTGKPIDELETGDRIKSVDVAAIVALINTATGKTHTPGWGKHVKVK